MKIFSEKMRDRLDLIGSLLAACSYLSCHSTSTVSLWDKNTVEQFNLAIEKYEQQRDLFHKKWSNKKNS